ncbi:hypothetical protein D3C84_269580 [compost metagenome]
MLEPLGLWQVFTKSDLLNRTFLRQCFQAVPTEPIRIQGLSTNQGVIKLYVFSTPSIIAERCAHGHISLNLERYTEVHLECNQVIVDNVVSTDSATIRNGCHKRSKLFQPLVDVFYWGIALFQGVRHSVHYGCMATSV